MTITVALSYGVRTMLCRESIYTEKLARRGHDIPLALQANAYLLQRTRAIMDTQFVSVPADGSRDDFVRLASEKPEVSCFLVCGPAGFIGFLTRDSALRPAGPADDHVTLADLADRRFITVGEDAPLVDVMTRLRAAGASVALVIDRAGPSSNVSVRGLVTRQQIASAVIDGLELFSEEPAEGEPATGDRPGGDRTALGQEPRPANPLASAITTERDGAGPSESQPGGTLPGSVQKGQPPAVDPASEGQR